MGKYNSDSYEQNLLHPVVARWLTDSGYEWEHECNVGGMNRVDFVAVHNELPIVLIVEVKAEIRAGGALLSVVRQMQRYMQPYGKLVVPVVVTRVHHAPIAFINEMAFRSLGIVYAQLPFCTDLWHEGYQSKYYITLATDELSQPDIAGIGIRNEWDSRYKGYVTPLWMPIPA